MNDPFKGDKDLEIEWTSKAITVAWLKAVEAVVPNREMAETVVQKALSNIFNILGGFSNDTITGDVAKGIEDPGVYVK